MNRDLAYYRKMRAKHIRRKKRISNSYFYPLELKYDGMYSKGKIHCSCPMCANKTNNKHLGRASVCWSPKLKNWKHSDLVNIIAMESELKEYEQII